MYFVIYEEYHEHNQFEGEWTKEWEEFVSLSMAETYAMSLSAQSEGFFRNVILLKRVID